MLLVAEVRIVIAALSIVIAGIGAAPAAAAPAAPSPSPSASATNKALPEASTTPAASPTPAAKATPTAVAQSSPPPPPRAAGQSTSSRRAAAAAAGFPAQYVPISPTRILDTRIGLGGYSRPFGPGGIYPVQVAGTAAVPASGAAAVVLNVTVTGPTAQSLLTVYPAGGALPDASTINFFAGQTIANVVTVNLGTGGGVLVYQANGATDVIFDVEGYYGSAPAGAGLYRPISPARILDTRTGEGASGQLGPGGVLAVSVAGRGGLPAAGISAVALNLTAVNGTQGSYLTAYPRGGSPPVASTVNFPPGNNVPNRVVVRLNAGEIWIYNRLGLVDVVADVDGWYTDGSDPTAAGGLYTGVAPHRALDTRNGTGAARPVGPGSTLGAQIGGIAGIPSGAGAAVLNTTITNPTTGSVLTVYPSNDYLPLASDLNFAPWQTVANMTPAQLGPDGRVTVWNDLGTTDVVADVEGWFSAAPAPGNPPAAPTISSLGVSSVSAISVSWTAPGSGLAITSYTVIVQPGARQVPVSGASTTATVAGLQCGLTYTFQVAATNPAGSGPASGPATTTLPACPTSNVIQDVPWIHQEYALSCEAAALQMVLYHENLPQSQSQILNDLGIDRRPAYWDANGLRWGDPFTNFVGNPNGAEYNYTGYGTYAPAIGRVASSYGASVLAAGSGVSPATVYQSVMDGHPVIAWITFTWSTPGRHDYLAFDGTWIPYAGPVEHTVAVVGVRPDAVLVNDPDRNQYWVAKSTFEAVYGVYGDMAVVIR